MNILIFNFEYPPLGGGGGIATADIAETLAARHDVTVITSRFRGLPAVAHHGRLTIHRVPVLTRRKLPTGSLASILSFIPAAAWLAWKVCREQPFDVVNAQFVIPSGIPAAAVARRYRIPLVISFVGGDLYDPTKRLSPHRFAAARSLVRLIARQAIMCTAISRDTMQRARTLHGVTQPITVTPLGIRPHATKPVSRRELGLPSDAFLFVTVGRLIPRKGYEQLLAVWRHVPQAHLAIIGDGPLRRRLEALIQSNKLTDRVHLLGFVPDEKKRQLLAVADAYISAATHEGFGIVFLEAMIAGLPIIATDTGGQNDVLVNGVNALLIPAGNPAALRQAVQTLQSDRELRQRLGGNNKTKVQEYSLESTTRLFEDVLLKAKTAYENRD